MNKAIFRDVFEYAAHEEKIFERFYERERLTTFYSDLSIAEWYGRDSIKDTFKRVVKYWKGDVKMFTEFVICLNMKIWEHYELGCYYENLYTELWGKACNIAMKTYKGEDLNYFLTMTD